MSAVVKEMTDSYTKFLRQQNYRVIEPFKPVQVYENHTEASDIRTAVYLDVETTGLNVDEDKIIELAMVKFQFSTSGKVLKIVDEFDKFNDPGMPLSPFIVKLTGITDEKIRGTQLKPVEVGDFVSGADLVIAHNAEFDRKFVEKNLQGLFEKLAWSCTVTQVPWQDKGWTSSKLEYLAYMHNFWFDAHRAIVDCQAGVHLLAQNWDNNRSNLALLLESARETTCHIWAENTPYETKDLLKNRGYKWSDGSGGTRKAWHKDGFSKDGAEQEKEWLQTFAYTGKQPRITIVNVNAFNRFSERA